MISTQRPTRDLAILLVLLASYSCGGGNDSSSYNLPNNEQSQSNPINDRGPLESPNLTRLRGAMCGDEYDEQNFEDLAAMGANLVRWHLVHAPDYDPDTVDLAQYRVDYLTWLETAMLDAELAAESAERHGIHIILDNPSAPGNKNENNGLRMLYDDDLAELFVEAWEILASRFQDTQSIYAFELMNEPSLDWWEEGWGVSFWNDLFLRTAERIRAIDPDRTIVYAPTPNANAGGFIGLDLLPIDNVIYSVHVYNPLAFTHQSVVSAVGADIPEEYPGVLPTDWWDRALMEYSGLTASDGAYWNKELLRVVMQPVLDFQLRHDVPIWVGEFSAPRYAPNNSTYRYLRDCLELFEEYGWDWTYHAFRSSEIWSVEHSTDRYDYTPSPTPTDRQLLLEYYFDLNEPAEWPP